MIMCEKRANNALTAHDHGSVVERDTVASDDGSGDDFAARELASTWW
jgi:hypothetical protein